MGAGAALACAAVLGGVTVAAGPAYATTYSCNHNIGYWYSGTATTEYGNTGSRVIEVQCLLYRGGYLTHAGDVDGIFGPVTRSAVRSFQTDYKSYCDSSLAVDGIVGPYTWAALRSNCPS